MITISEFAELLKQQESPILDFKQESYRLDNDYNVSEFVKDILAFANTPRTESAHIVIGVVAHEDGTKDFLGVKWHPDDNDLQQKLDKVRPDPKPEFLYQPITLEGITYGIIEIPITEFGPYCATKDMGVVKAHRLYYRDGTRNKEAEIKQEKDAIYDWFRRNHNSIDVHDSAAVLSACSPHWDELSVACHHFDTGRLYIFLLGPEGSKPASESWRYLARLPLSLVLDFDPSSEERGVYSFVGPELSGKRSVHLWTLGNESGMIPAKACYWYAARGLQGRESSLVDDDWRSWNRKYSAAIHGLLEEYAKASGGRPITLVSLWHAPQYVREVCTVVDRVLGDLVDYVIAVPEPERLQDLAEQFNASVVNLGSSDLLHGIAANLPSGEQAYDLPAGLPQVAGGFHILSAADLNWLSEDMEVLHSSVELEAPREPSFPYDYLRGATILPSDLANHLDADRDKTTHVIAALERELETRTTARLNLYHWPGAGGSTVAQRAAWELHRRYPVVLLKHIVMGETVGRFRKIFGHSGLPILAIVEGADTVPDSLELLYTEIKAELLPVVFLSVLRKFDQQRDGKRSIFLSQSLSAVESYRFSEAYRRASPSRGSYLN